jgi:hypothetical protein
LTEAQRKTAEQTLRKRYHWLFDNGKKGVQQILGKRKPQTAMDYVVQSCPCGIQWALEDSRPCDYLQHLAQATNRWIDPSRHLLQVAESHVSITVKVLTDLYPLIQCCLKLPPFPDGPPPRLVYGTGPWTDDNLSTALEFSSRATHITPRPHLINVDIKEPSL